jgi:hypothetical protein
MLNIQRIESDAFEGDTPYKVPLYVAAADENAPAQLPEKQQPSGLE